MLSPKFSTIEIKTFVLESEGRLSRGIFSPDTFQIALLISVVNAVLAKYKVPIRLTTSVY